MGVEIEQFIKIAKEKNIEVVFADVDHTLVDGNCGSIFSKHLFRKGLLSWRSISRIPHQTLLYKLGLLDYSVIIEQALSAWKGKSVASLEEEGRICYANQIQARLFPETKTLINLCSQNDIQLVLISASPPQLLKHMAEDLNVDMIATQLAVEHDQFTGKIDGDFCFGQGKVQLIKQWAAQKNKELNYMSFSDSISDLPMLLAAEVAVAVNPDFRLKKQAKKRNWPILNWQRKVI